MKLMHEINTGRKFRLYHDDKHGANGTTIVVLTVDGKEVASGSSDAVKAAMRLLTGE